MSEPTNPISVSAGSSRLIAWTVAGVVLCFLVATGLSQHRQVAIDRRVSDIVANAMPSVQYLGRVRSAVRRLSAMIREDIDSQRPLTVDEREGIEDDRRAIAASLAAYEALPFFPQEAILYHQGVVRDLSAVDESIAGAFASADAGDVAGSQAALQQAVRRIDRLDEAVHRLVEFDASQGQRLALEIEQERRHSVNLAFILDLASVALALIATVMMMRTFRRTIERIELKERTAEQSATISAARASELELFAGRVAHDLKGPLTAIGLRVEACARNERLDPDARKNIEPVMRYVARMKLMIDGLLGFARSGARPRPGECSSLGDVLSDAIDVLRDEADAVHARLELENLPSCTIACSRGALTSVVSNLLRNAIKFIVDGPGPERYITIRARTRGKLVRVEIQDTGPGIASEHQTAIFDPYVRATNPSRPGLGLGLATVKRIVEAHRGTVGVESTVGEGSCFWFELPLGESPTPPGSNDTAAREPEPSGRNAVLH